MGNQPSTSGQLPKEPDNQNLDSNSSTDLSETDTTPTKSARGKPTTKNIVDSWKNTATRLWKPASKVVISPDPEAISTRTQSKANQDVPEQMASHPHDLNIDAMCCDQNRQKCAKSPSSFQKNWKLCYKCALSSRQNISQSVTNH